MARRRRRVGELCGVLGLLASFALRPGLAVAADPAPPSEVRIQAIEFEGNRSIRDGALRSAMRLKQPSSWNPFSKPKYLGSDFLASDLGNVVAKYRQSGFPLARVNDALVEYGDNGRVRIRITIDEGPRVRLRGLRIEGVDPKTERTLRDLVSLKRGDLVTSSMLARTEGKLAEYHAGRGLLLAQLTRELAFGASADSALLVLRVHPGDFVAADTIVVEGLVKTRRETVLREMAVKQGALLTGRRIVDSRERLQNLGLFRFVSVEPVFLDSTALSRAQLRVRVSERKSRSLSAGVGYSSQEDIEIVADSRVNNLQGRGRRITGQTEVDLSLARSFRGGGLNFRRATVDLRYFDPHFAGTRNRISVGPTFRTEFFDPGSGDVSLTRETPLGEWKERSIGGVAAVARDINRTTRLSLSLEDREVWTEQPGGDPRYSTRFASTLWRDDHRDNAFDPTAGYLGEFGTDYSLSFLNGSYQFARFTTTWQGYARLPEGWVGAARLRLGHTTPLTDAVADANVPGVAGKVPSAERFRVGGANSIRGYRENDAGYHPLNSDDATGGLSLAVLNLEMRFPIYGIVNAGFFLDGGNVWRDASEIKPSRLINGFRRLRYDPLDLHWGLGTGLRVASPVGPVRFDYAVKVGSGRRPGSAGGEWYFALGQAY